MRPLLLISASIILSLSSWKQRLVVDALLSSPAAAHLKPPAASGAAAAVIGPPRTLLWRLYDVPPTKKKTKHLNDTATSIISTPIRLNKVFKATHSRRQADALIASGRVMVNDVVSRAGCMVVPYQDVVKLDDRVVEGWESMNGFVLDAKAIDAYTDDNGDDMSHNKKRKNDQPSLNDNRSSSSSTTTSFEYLKYWKPKGVVCTTDRRIQNNIMDEITTHGRNNGPPKHRVYPVGRLDKDTTGLILLTSDGRLPNATLRKRRRQQQQPTSNKIYHVLVDHPLTDTDIQRLRDGIVITTVAKRDGRAKPPLAVRTKPCLVKRHETNPCVVQMTLQEGRNRQVRKMMAALNYNVVALHRIQFGDITLEGLEGPGDWKRLNHKEMKWVESVL
jgi:pseudouridine synthase